MNRGLTLSLCAVALAAMSVSSAFAVVDISLNLRYTDPANPSEGGTFQLVAQTDDPNGIAAINALLQDVDNGATDITMNAGIGAIDPIDAGGANERPPYLDLGGGATDLIYGQDISDPGSVVVAVGTGSGAPGDIGPDPLQNSIWDNASLIASGTFGATRPSFNGADANELDGTSGPFTASDDGTTGTTVRGDSVATDGLALGDHDRDFDVDGNDLDTVLFSFNQAVAAANAWDLGDSTNDDMVDGNDLDNVLFSFNTNQTPPSVAGVPEPASLMLLGLGAASMACLRRRS